MLRKFIDGLLFGSGFTVAVLVVWCLASYFVFPAIFGSQRQQETISFQSQTSSPPESPFSGANSGGRGVEKPFHELSLDEQIKRSSVVAIAKFEAAADGKQKAVIKEFLKKDPSTTIYYNIGDEYPSSSYYPKDNQVYGEGVVIFFEGSPADMRMTASYDGDRIHGLSDIPIELLRKKCSQ